jgi:hypothetical protein
MELSPEEFAVAEERLRNPRPGGRIEAARRFGVDLSLLIETLRLTPAERVKRMHGIIETMDGVRGAARKSSE